MPWKVGYLKSALSAIFTCDSMKGVLIVVLLDGIDESNSHDLGDDASRTEILEFLLGLTATQPLLKLILLSRPEDDIYSCLHSEYFISLHNVNRPDIERLIQTGIERLSLRLDGYDPDKEGTSPADVELCSLPAGPPRPYTDIGGYFYHASTEKSKVLVEIKSYLEENARNVILWISIVLAILEDCCKDCLFYEVTDLQTELHNLPLELDSLYTTIATKLVSSFRGRQKTLEKCRRVLMWVSVSASHRHWLQMQDLLEVVSQSTCETKDGSGSKPAVLGGFSDWNSFKRDIQRLCGPFIDVVPIQGSNLDTKQADATQWDILQLSHETVRMFLQKESGLLAIGFTETEAEQTVLVERRSYMRRSLPPLAPLLESLSGKRIKLQGDEELQHLCGYIDTRPLLCFVLLSMDFEVSVLSRIPDNSHRLARIFRTPSADTHIDGFALLTAMKLLRLCGFAPSDLDQRETKSAAPSTSSEGNLGLQRATTAPSARRRNSISTRSGSQPCVKFAGLNSATSDSECSVWQYSRPFYSLHEEILFNAFRIACSKGLLHTVNVLSSLVIFPTESQIRAIADSLLEVDVARGVSRCPSTLTRFEDLFRKEYVKREAFGSSVIDAAISQVTSSGVLDGESAIYTAIRDSLCLPVYGTDKPSSLQVAENGNIGRYRRTPFTVLWRQPDLSGPWTLRPPSLLTHVPNRVSPPTLGLPIIKSSKEVSWKELSILRRFLLEADNLYIGSRTLEQQKKLGCVPLTRNLEADPDAEVELETGDILEWQDNEWVEIVEDGSSIEDQGSEERSIETQSNEEKSSSEDQSIEGWSSSEDQSIEEGSSSESQGDGGRLGIRRQRRGERGDGRSQYGQEGSLSEDEDSDTSRVTLYGLGVRSHWLGRPWRKKSRWD